MTSHWESSFSLWKFQQLTTTRSSLLSSFQRQPLNVVLISTTITMLATTWARHRMRLRWKSRMCRMRRTTWCTMTDRTQPGRHSDRSKFNWTSITLLFLQLIGCINYEFGEKRQQQAALQLRCPHRYRWSPFVLIWLIMKQLIFLVDSDGDCSEYCHDHPLDDNFNLIKIIFRLNLSSSWDALRSTSFN